MRDDQTDLQDTLIIPFAWVPDGAAEPIDWLMCHPDAFRLAATLKGTASSRPVIRDAAIGSAAAGVRLPATGQTPDAQFAAGDTWPVPCNPRRRPSAYWLTAAGARQHDPAESSGPEPVRDRLSREAAWRRVAEQPPSPCADVVAALSST